MATVPKDSIAEPFTDTVVLSESSYARRLRKEYCTRTVNIFRTLFRKGAIAIFWGAIALAMYLPGTIDLRKHYFHREPPWATLPPLPPSAWD